MTDTTHPKGTMTTNLQPKTTSPVKLSDFSSWLFEFEQSNYAVGAEEYIEVRHTTITMLHCSY